MNNYSSRYITKSHTTNQNNKIINSKCHCGMGLPWLKLEVIMLEPCEHLIHEKCFNNLNTDHCPICKELVLGITRKNDYKYNSKLYQKCVDIISMSNFDDMSKHSSVNAFENFPLFIGIITELFVTRGVHQGKFLVSEILSMNDTDLHVSGLNKIKNEPKIFIANHTSHLDFIVLFYILKSGFLSSSAIYENFLTRKLTEIIPLLIIDRGKQENTVEKIKKYVDDTGSICLFPEGMITHPDTLIKFRTGAFHAGHPIYPVVIKYSPVVADMETNAFILKLASQQKVKVYIQILDPFYPPFDEKKIEKVRRAMANAGNLFLSRVSNRDIRETITKDSRP